MEESFKEVHDIMKKKLAWILAIALIISVLGSAGNVSAGPVPAEEAIAQGESAEGESPEGESLEGGSEEAEAAQAEGESTEGGSGGSGSGASEGESGEMANNGSPVSFGSSEIVLYDPVDYTCIPAEGEQAALSTVLKPVIEVDGLKFRDLDEDGELDVYEDWREDSETRTQDLLDQMTDVEKGRMLFHADLPTTMGESLEDGELTVWYFITQCGCLGFLNNNYKGGPDNMANIHNHVQAIAEENRLGIPVTISSDRMYNVWAGYIDTPHDAYGTAHDLELSKVLWNLCSQEVAAVGIHVTLQPYSVEIGAWDGESPEYIAEMIGAEVEALQSGGVFTCTKHYITRGGDASFSQAKSPAANIDNYMYCWKSAIDAGTRWIMTNGEGFNEGLCTDYDPECMDYLRNTLGYDGVIITDWGAVNLGATGVIDGVDLSTLSIPERYAWMVTNTVDQLGINNLTLDESQAAGNCYWVVGMDQAIEEGLLSMEAVDASCRRLLMTKFDLGLFDNPYSDPEEALKIAASAEYIAEKWEITNIDELDAARNPEVVNLERQLMAESAVLVKNDENLLPLEQGVAVYYASTASEYNTEEIKKAIGQYCTIVDDMEAADVVIADCTSLTDAAELIIEDAKDFEKKLVIVTNCVDPDTWVMEQGDAVLFMNYDRTPDHGTALNGFVLTTEPQVYADLMFGMREPSGMIVKEIARDAMQDDAQWKDLAGDMGANGWVRLMLEATMLTSENHATPENWGDPLLCYKYGMRYGEEPAFRYQTLVVPQETVVVEEWVEFMGSNVESAKTVNQSYVGKPFQVQCLLFNDGSDGVTTAQLLVDGELAAQKVMAVNGGSWRIVEFELVIDEAGEHVITLGDLETIITIE